jgi:uncharacterized protein YchJ
MALADIQKESADERKREKRLVHVTNALARDYILSQRTKKTKVEKENAEYIVKSMLDYLFFHERKEIQELQNKHIHNFMMVHAPNKLSLSAAAGTTAPETITSFLVFLQEHGHIKNASLLVQEVKTNKQAFLKLMPKAKKKPAPKKAAPRKKAKKAKVEIKVGRNDPCPCGSGKKYKKCCGLAK